MSNFRDTIHDSPQYQGQQANEQPETPAEAVEPLIQLEKGDMEFWMDVATVVLLFLIYREMLRGGMP